MDKWQIFTPDTYVEKMLDIAGYRGEDILYKSILENSCGNGNILKKVVERFVGEAIKIGIKRDIISKLLATNIVGFEIDHEVRKECLKNLNYVTDTNLIPRVDWQIYEADYLSYDVQRKFDFIIGNPPYITYQELTNTQRDTLKKNFISCRKGKFDYCYPFIEKSLRDLNEETGKLVYLIPSSIFKNVFGQSLRELLIKDLTEVYDYGNIKVFENALVSASIVYVNRLSKTNALNYYKISSDERKKINKEELGDKWSFFSNEQSINENTEKLGEYFKVSNSVATLLNEVFVLTNFEDIDDKYIRTSEGSLIEKKILKKAASPRSKAYDKKEMIIFPYYYKDKQLLSYTEQEFMEKFPKTYEYLLVNKDKLLMRKSDKKAQWFEYGRSQALQYMHQPKLLLSSVITRKVNIYELDKETIPYSGFYIIPKGNLSLEFAKEVIESPEFLKYLSNKGINASGHSLRFSVTDFLNYKISTET